MIESITLLDTTSGRSIQFEKDKESMFVLESVDWDIPNISFDTYKVPFQKGYTVSGVNVGGRNPIIYGYIIANTREIKKYPRTAFYEEQLRQIEENKKILNSYFSIYRDCRIVANDKYLTGRLSTPPKYSVSEKENNEVMCRVQLSFECFDPMFYGDSISTQLFEVDKTFRFPLHPTSTDKIIFGTRESRESVLLNNEGDVEVGCEITLLADGGSVTNPSVYNISTGDIIKLEGLTLNDGDYITINTKVGSEDILLHSRGIITSAIGYMTTYSSMFKIQQGGQYFGSSADIGESLLDVSIEYTEQYFNLKEM